MLTIWTGLNILLLTLYYTGRVTDKTKSHTTDIKQKHSLLTESSLFFKYPAKALTSKEQ